MFYQLFQKASCSSGEQNKGVSYIGKKPMSAFVSIAPHPPPRQKKSAIKKIYEIGIRRELLFFRHSNLFFAGLPQLKHTMLLYFCLQFFSPAAGNPLFETLQRFYHLFQKTSCIRGEQNKGVSYSGKNRCQHSSALLRTPPLVSKSKHGFRPPPLRCWRNIWQLPVNKQNVLIPNMVSKVVKKSWAF